MLSHEPVPSCPTSQRKGPVSIACWVIGPIASQPFLLVKVPALPGVS